MKKQEMGEQDDYNPTGRLVQIELGGAPPVRGRCVRFMDGLIYVICVHLSPGDLNADPPVYFQTNGGKAQLKIFNTQSAAFVCVSILGECDPPPRE